MLELEMAAVAIVAFFTGVLRDPRSFGNAVLLGLALALSALGVAERLADMPGRPERLLLLALALAVGLGPFLIACYLLANGVTMARRESLRPGNLLSFVAGIAILVMLALNAAADRLGSVKLGLLGTASALVFGYVSFLLFSYVIYAWIYGHGAALVTRAAPAPVAGEASCVIVTSGYHVLRTAILARRAGLRGQVTGARTAAYYWPSATLREFGAVLLRYRAVNLGVCAMLAFTPVADVMIRRL